MNKITPAIFCTLLSLLLSSPVFADNPEVGAEQPQVDRPMGHHGKKMHKRHMKMMKRVDSNQDGKIDLSEYLANAEQRFNKLDLDGDGYVTPEEHREAGKKMREKHREMRKQRRVEREARDEPADQE